MKNETPNSKRKENLLPPHRQVVLREHQSFTEQKICWFFHDSDGKRVGLVRSFFAVKEGSHFKIFGVHVRTEKPTIVTISMESRRGTLTHPSTDMTLAELRAFVEAAYPAASSMNTSVSTKMV